MNVHSLVQICAGLNDSELIQLASQLEGIVGDSTRMRYPDMVCFPQIPNEVYTVQMAQKALQLAKRIVERVQSRIIWGFYHLEMNACPFMSIHAGEFTQSK